MTPEFRHLEIADTDAVVTLLQKVLPDDQPHNEPAGFDGHRGWLYQLAVDPTRRRSGLATGLVRYATECLRALGCKKLNLQVRERNVEAESFYESLGFIKEPRTSMGKLVV